LTWALLALPGATPVKEFRAGANEMGRHGRSGNAAAEDGLKCNIVAIQLGSILYVLVDFVPLQVDARE
jgi:hypothetical protein